MRRISVLVCLLFACCTRLFAQEQAENKTIPNPPHFDFVNRDSVYDFGEMGENAEASYKFQFKNTGGEPLIITRVHCSSGNVKIKWPEKPIKKGKKALFEVTYFSDDNTGSFKNDILVTSNATTVDYPLLHISGTVMPGSFGAPIPGKSAGKSGGRGKGRMGQ